MRDNDFTPKIEILQQRLSELQRCATENPAQLASALPETFRELLNVLEELRESEEKYCILSDITERARAEEALRESEDRYRRITEAVTDYIYTVRVEGGQAVETTHGPACVAVTGYTSEEFAADPYLWLSMVDERDRAAVLEQAQRVLTGEAIGPLEHRIIRKDGAQRWVRNTPVPHWDPQGKLLSYDGLIRDITERKRAEVALRRRNTELEALYKTSLEINAQPDLSTLLHTIVERAVELLGARMGGLYLMRPDGQTLELVVSYNLPGDYAGVTLRLGEGLSGQIAQTGEPMMIEDYRHWEGRALIYADGPFRRVLGVPLKVGGKVIGVINITDDKQTGPFSEDEVRLVSLFADQAAIAVENARLYETSQRELAERVRAEEALRESEARYRSLFEDMPISLWEEDLSEIKKYIDTLRAADVSDLRAYFNDHPEAVIHCAGLIKVLEVNQVTLELYKADTKEGLTEGLEASRSYGPFEKTQYKPFRDELIARAEGRTHFESEESQYDLVQPRAILFLI
jgi:PAS domain S-box-containing protein